MNLDSNKYVKELIIQNILKWIQDGDVQEFFDEDYYMELPMDINGLDVVNTAFNQLVKDSILTVKATNDEGSKLYQVLKPSKRKPVWEREPVDLAAVD